MMVLCVAACTLDKYHLGYLPKEVGTHSIRPFVIIAMYLARLLVFSTMLIGCWSIHKQVQKFSSRVGNCIITTQNFCTVPSFIPKGGAGPTTTTTTLNF